MLNQELINFANHLADLSQKVIKKYFRNPHDEETKEDDSPVTKADRGAEEVIRKAIEEKFPTHGIIGEEFGIKEGKSEFTWILDPIDGTSSFITGRATFGTLIALAKNGEIVLGITNQPIANERWLAVKNHGAFLNGKKIQTRECHDLANAVMCSSSSFYFQNGDEEILKKISSKTKYQKLGGIIYGGDCYSNVCLASGFVDIVIDPGLKVYDYAATKIIVEEAGGVVTDWEGKDPGLNSGVKILACGDKRVHEQVLGLISK